MSRYIVEARSTTGQPSLYSVSQLGMAECDRKDAARFDEETARRVAKNEKRLRPGRSVFVIKVGA